MDDVPPADPAPRALFVYGTLMPGHLRWPLLEPHATRWWATTAPGRLYDTGRGWPTAVLDRQRKGGGAGGGGGRVPGWAVEVRPDRLAGLLAKLDVVEGVADGLYRRVVVALDDGSTAWAWSAAHPVDGLELIGAWEGRPEH